MEVVILIGLQGSGKTTFYRERLQPTHAHVSKDSMKGAKSKQARQDAMLEELLAAGESLAVDNTNVRREDREDIIALARKHGACVVGYFFDVPVGECIARNEQRAGRGRVPPAVIHTYAHRLERPTLDEGFDALHVVPTLEE